MGSERTGQFPVTDPRHWEAQYRSGPSVWETGRPARELRRVLAEHAIPRGRALELGCGTGSSAVWLACQGFAVTALDLSRVAIRRARRRARRAGVAVDFRAVDLTAADAVDGHFDFFFDGGCYHAVRLADRAGYFRTVVHATWPGSMGLILVGNAAEAEDALGPPVMTERELRDEWEQHFAVVQLRPFCFDARRAAERHYLGWSCLVRRPAAPAW